MHSFSLRRAALALLAAFPALLSAQTAPTALPAAPIRNVPEVFFGTTVDDPYRDFETIKAPAVAAWMKAHSEHASATLKRISGRAALRDTLERFEGAAAGRGWMSFACPVISTSTSAAAPRKTSSSSTCGRACKVPRSCSSTPKN